MATQQLLFRHQTNSLPIDATVRRLKPQGTALTHTAGERGIPLVASHKSLQDWTLQVTSLFKTGPYKSQVSSRLDPTSHKSLQDWTLQATSLFKTEPYKSQVSSRLNPTSHKSLQDWTLQVTSLFKTGPYKSQVSSRQRPEALEGPMRKDYSESPQKVRVLHCSLRYQPSRLFDHYVQNLARRQAAGAATQSTPLPKSAQIKALTGWPHLARPHKITDILRAFLDGYPTPDGVDQQLKVPLGLVDGFPLLLDAKHLELPTGSPQSRFRQTVKLSRIRLIWFTTV
ncbi:hypothetical protein RRG08_039248 [Elysia crispata]|uniref:Uncharacterized protein n=1 Tax=Elysia crispata TaxID=231223 RepID=A0AAE1BGJ7_9GAST|nr:hypothetical protein RRG08_039248 [Elysia crispata]